MPKKSIFDEIFEINDDFKGFEHLFTKKIKKQLYNKCRSRCLRRKNADYRNCLFSELIHEMRLVCFGQEPAQKHRRDVHRSTEKIIDQFIKETKGVKKIDFWEPVKPTETSKDIEREFNRAVESRFESDFCPIHKIRKPCRLCQLEIEEENNE